MAFNAQPNAPQVTLETFGSLVTETPAQNLPPGVSPDNQDLVYVPGGTASRGALQKAFASAFTGTPTVTYGKSYVDPTGVIRNLYLDSNGQLWQETTFGVASTLSLLAATGIYCKSITAFGREYLAPSDGLHGADIPLQYDGTNLDRVTQEGPGAAPTVANLAIAPAAIVQPNGLQRASNVVTVTTSAAHSFQVGNQVQVQGAAGAPCATGLNNVVSIVIDNENSPGLATVTLTSAHELVPGNFVYIQSVTAVTVGTGISSTTTTGGVITVKTSAAHGLSPGALVTIASAADTTANGNWIVTSVPDSKTFTVTTTATAATSGGAAGTVALNWPLPAEQSASTNQTPNSAVYQVLTCPSSTVFTIAIGYSDGTWTTGTVFFTWNGIFYVASVPSNTTFTYFAPGPDGGTTNVGGPAKVSYYGQVTPGTHLCQVLFVTRQGYITRGSPAVSVIAPGGQYLQVSNIPIGPSNVVARILAFTGAQPATLQGALAPFFYIPVPAQVGTQVVSSATQINDNTTTSVTLDFSDNTLFAAAAISIPGNNLQNQIVIDGALGFGFYGSRLITWGQRNRIQNLLNMMFDGGFLSGSTTVPLGWTVAGAGSLVTSGRWGGAYQLGAASVLSQSFYLDSYGTPIGTPTATYRARCWLKGATASVTFTISSVSTGFSSTVTLTTANNTTGAWVEGAFNNAMPSAIPSDMLLKISGSSGTVDEMSILYAQTPYLDTLLFGSYVNNPEAFDGLSGKFGPADDVRKVMDLGIIRSNLYLLTREPGGRLHQTSNNAYTEPAGWSVEEIAGSCGLLSAFALTKSQADDATAAGGEEWLAWASGSGARIFGGDQAFKISQEIQPDWNAINPAAALTIWALNDPTARCVYFGLPMGTATAPTLVYPLDYRGLNTAYEIAERTPVRVSFSGKLLATDIARKWTRWTMTMNGAALLYRSTGSQLSLVLFGGNGSTPGAVAGFGNVYTPTGNSFVDDDYGQFFPYYTTHFFVTGELEQAFQLGGFRKIVEYLAANVACIGHVSLTVYVNTLSNPWALTVTRQPGTDPKFDLEWSGGDAAGQRFAFKIAATP